MHGQIVLKHVVGLMVSSVSGSGHVVYIITEIGYQYTSGEDRSTIWSCYTKFKSLLLFITLEIDL